MFLCFTALCHYELSTHSNGIVAVAMATVRPDSMTKWPKTSQRDVTHVPNAVSVTSLMTSSRQLRCGVTSFSRHYGPKRMFLAPPRNAEIPFFAVLGLFKAHACAH